MLQSAGGVQNETGAVQNPLVANALIFVDETISRKEKIKEVYHMATDPEACTEIFGDLNANLSTYLETRAYFVGGAGTRLKSNAMALTGK